MRLSNPPVKVSARSTPEGPVGLKSVGLAQDLDGMSHQIDRLEKLRGALLERLECVCVSLPPPGTTRDTDYPSDPPNRCPVSERLNEYISRLDVLARTFEELAERLAV